MRLQPAEVAGGELFQVFAEVNQADAVDRLGPVLLGGDAVVEQDDVGAGVQLLVGDGLEQGEADPFLDRLGVLLDVEEGHAFEFAQPLGEGLALGGDEQPAAGQAGLDRGPVEVGFGDEQDGVGRQIVVHLPGRLQECRRLLR